MKEKPKRPTPPKNGFGKCWLGDTLMDIATDRPIMTRTALRSLKERRR